ncbi:MAG: peptidylprolyl isomerase [Kiritimatiellia bacterium]
MKHTKLFSVTLLTALAFLAGCNEKKGTETEKDANAATGDKTATAEIKPDKPTDPNEVVASVNDKEYTRKDLNTMVETIMKARNVPADQKAMAKNQFEKQIVYSFIMKSLLLDEAGKSDIKVSEEERQEQLEKVAEQLKAQNKTIEQYFKESPIGEKRARKEFADSLLIDKLLNTKIVDKIEISDAEAKEQIEKIKQANKESEEKNNNLDNINAEKKEKIAELKKQLDDGADFAKLAEENSDCPSGQKGGNLGSFGHGQMVPEFENAAFSQEIGEVGDIVETQFGYHLIKVTAKSPAVEAEGDTPAKPETVTASHILLKTEQAGEAQPVPTLEEMKDTLRKQKSQAETQTYISGLKSNAVIETIFEDLPL